MVEVKSTNRVCFCVNDYWEGVESRVVVGGSFCRAVAGAGLWSVPAPFRSSMQYYYRTRRGSEAMQQGSQFDRPPCFCSDVPNDTIERMEQCDAIEVASGKSKSTFGTHHSQRNGCRCRFLLSPFITFVSGFFYVMILTHSTSCLLELPARRVSVLLPCALPSHQTLGIIKRRINPIKSNHPIPSPPPPPPPP